MTLTAVCFMTTLRRTIEHQREKVLLVVNSFKKILLVIILQIVDILNTNTKITHPES